MTPSQLQLFLTVYEKCSITEAAHALGIEQPTVSRTIGRIEKELGTPLFDRFHKRISPTNVADKLYAYGKPIFDMIEKTKTAIKDDAIVIKMGCSTTIGTLIAPLVISNIQKDNPKVRFQSIVDTQDKLVEMLSLGLLDFALIEDGIIYKDCLSYEKIGGDVLIPIMSYDSPHRGKSFTFAEFAQLPMITRETGSSGRQHIETLFTLHKCSLSPVAECSSTLAVIEHARFGLGVSLIPELYAKSYIENNILSTCFISDESMSRDYYLVINPRKYRDNTILRIIETIKEYISPN